MILILSIITVVCLAFIMYFYLEHNYDGYITSLLGLVMIAMIGWGMIGLNKPVKTSYEKTLATVFHDTNRVHLMVNGEYYKSYNDIVTRSYLSNKTMVPMDKIIKFNCYGGVVFISYTFPTNEY